VQANESPGLFLLAWGLFASVFGLAMVTNFRGFADNVARRRRVSRAGLWKTPSWKMQPQDPAARVKQQRLFAVPFAIIGPIVTVIGIISISHKGIGSFGPSAPPGPVRIVVIGFAVAAVAWPWLWRNGLYRRVVRRGGWRLATALVSSAGGLAFGVGIATGQTTIAVVAWVICGLSTAVLMLQDKPMGPGPGGDRTGRSA